MHDKLQTELHALATTLTRATTTSLSAAPHTTRDHATALSMIVDKIIQLDEQAARNKARTNSTRAVSS